MNLEKVLRESEVVESGVDWLTATMEPGAKDYEHLRTFAELMQMQERMKGHDVKAIAPQGYHGLATPHIFVGERSDGLMCRFSSEAANGAAKGIIQRGYEIRATRLDFQVTVRTAEKAPTLPTLIRGHIRNAESQSKARRKVSAILHESDRRGHSVTIGSRTSARLYRCYDKTLEQKRLVIDNLMRHEVEIKQDDCRFAWKMLTRAASPEVFALAVVASHLLGLGFRQPWRGDIQTCDIPTSYTETDDERRLRWLENHVGGTVKRLWESGHHKALEMWFQEFTQGEAA